MRIEAFAPMVTHTRPGCSHLIQGAGFRVQGAGFRVQGAGFRVQGSVGAHGHAHPPRLLSPDSEGSYLRLIDFCITQL